MADWSLNLTGNIESKSLSSAGAVDIFTAALKAEEKALASARIAATRTAAGLDPRQYTRASNAVKEATARLGLLRAEEARLAKPAQRDRRYDSTASGTLKGLRSAVPKAAASFKELKQPSELLVRVKEKANDAAKAVGGGLSSAAKIAGSALTTTLVVGTALAVAGTALFASKLYAVGKAAITAGVGFVDEARSARLLNEAADIAGGTHRQLGGVIEDVNRRATIGKDRIAQLGRELRGARFDSRQTQLTLDAMAVAESALGQGASAAVRGIADASRATRKFSLGIRDAYGEYESLKASGLTKGEVFGELAASMHISVDAVKREVGAGRISVTRGMQAIDTAMRKKFGANVAAQALGIGRQFSRMSEDVTGLFSGANAEPLLKGLSKITGMFSKDTAEGKAFGEVVSRVMNELGKTAEALAPQIKEFIVGLGADAAKPGGLAETIKGWISDAKDLGATLKDVASAIKDIAGAAKTIGGAVSSVTGSFTHKADEGEVSKLNSRLEISAQLSQQGKKEGEALTAGVAAGIDTGAAVAVGKMEGFAAKLEAAFKTANQIHSPAGLYKPHGRRLPEGVGVGVEEGTPTAVASIVDMSAAMASALDMPSSPAQSSSKAGNTYHLNVTNHGIPGADEIGPELVRWIKYANDSGPRPSHV